MRSRIIQEVKEIFGLSIYLPDYWFFYALFILIGFVVSNRLAAKRGISEVRFYKANLIIMACAYIGARFYYIILYTNNIFNINTILSEIIKPGGTGSFGAYIGFIISSFIVFRLMNIHILTAFDIYAPIFALSLILGRLGCFIKGCCYGKVCNLPWSVSFPPDSPVFRSQVQRGLISINQTGSLPVHPTQLYEILFGIVMLIVLTQLYRRSLLKGCLFFIYFTGYSIFRFLIEFFRGDVRESTMLISVPQLMSLLILIFSIVGLLIVFKDGLEKSEI